tara:strand:+ start:459 stop:629 length:171 start_codon:yes stop_codon:yes gene_type:complete
MAKVFKITTGTIDVVVTETYDNEYAAFVGEDPQSADVKITEYKIENTKWKKEKVNE